MRLFPHVPTTIDDDYLGQHTAGSSCRLVQVRCSRIRRQRAPSQWCALYAARTPCTWHRAPTLPFLSFAFFTDVRTRILSVRYRRNQANVSSIDVQTIAQEDGARE